MSWRSGKNLHCIQCNQCICMYLWFYCGIIEIALHLQKKNIKRKMKNEVKEDELWELYYQKWWHVSRDCEVFHGKKKMVTYPLVIHCILWSLRIRLFTRICMRHKLITIVTDKNKRLSTQCFSSHFILIIHCYHWYQEWICWKLWNKTALGARYHVDQCLNIKKLNINKNKWWNYTRTLILAVFFFMELDSYFSFYKGISVFLTCIYENHHCNVFFFLPVNVHSTCNMLRHWTI